MSEYTPLQVGQKLNHGQYFFLDVRQEKDGVYPFVRTGEATMILPWRIGTDGTVEVCLLLQERVDTAGKLIYKVCGGYNGNLSRDEAGLAHLLKKTGCAPHMNDVRWWRQSLGIGPQYQFPIWYGFLKEPQHVAKPTTPGCAASWLSLSAACRFATAADTDFFDELSTAMLLMLMMHYGEW